MDNILNQRWNEVDKLIIKLQKNLNTNNESLKSQVQELFNSLDIQYDDLNKTIPNELMIILKDKHKQVKKLSSYNGYFKYQIEHLITSRINYRTYIEIMLYMAYLTNLEDNYKATKEIFIQSALVTYNQGRNDLNKKQKSILPLMILTMLDKLYVDGVLLEEYMQSITLTNIQEINRTILMNIQQQRPLSVTSDNYKILFEKQRKRLINIRVDDTKQIKESDTEIQLPLNKKINIKRAFPNKYVISGGLDKYLVAYCNKAYLESAEDDNQIVVFVAKMDYKTTKMCSSMNQLIFNTKDLNIFKRWSEIDNNLVTYKVKGLVTGVNLPPINNHQHPCRSTIYLLPRDLYTKEEVRDLQERTMKVVKRKTKR